MLFVNLDLALIDVCQLVPSVQLVGLLGETTSRGALQAKRHVLWAKLYPSLPECYLMNA
jgi:hypothetical protein